jgi:ADP-ribose pyrophosphatase YjhB (NUDIX family)
MSRPTNKLTFKGHEITLTWIRTNNFSRYKHINQVYAVIFNSKGEILICRKDKESDWHLPGGSVENDEHLKETLVREVIEEVDIEISNITNLGVQKVEFPKNPNKRESSIFYQARLLAKVKNILPQTADPDDGIIWERRFVKASDVKKFVKWKKTGNAMFDDAISLYKNL